IKLQPYSQRLAGVIAAKDIEKGYHWSTSNTEIQEIVGVEKQLTSMINDPTSEVNTLNEAGIVKVFNSFGTGFRTWGNRSAAFPSLTLPTNFINVRRTADILHESVEYSMLQFIDYPIDNGLIDSICETVNQFIRTLIGRGALIDGKCTFNQDKNPTTELANGHLLFDIEFMPPTPAERITFESFIDIELLKSLGAS
ncbi:phage tail sheath subtilisin-like domain-containing protein, partial [bacterium]|nr:phage tail sheath subtilisin-like domain-containing protein [bacterium]